MERQTNLFNLYNRYYVSISQFMIRPIGQRRPQYHNQKFLLRGSLFIYLMVKLDNKYIDISVISNKTMNLLFSSKAPDVL